MRNKYSNILMIILLVATWCIIAFSTFAISVISDIYKYFCGGILKYIILLVYSCAVVLPIVFRKKLADICPLPVVMICTAILSVLVIAFAFACARCYISDFSPSKWDKNEKLRIYMLDDLENEHELIGESFDEIIQLLGQPTYTSQDECCYQYYVGDSLIDPITFDIFFSDGMVIKTKLTEH